MAHIFLDHWQFRKDIVSMAEKTSYRAILINIDMRMSLSKLHRIAKNQANPTFEEFESICRVLGTSYNDYIVEHMI